MNSNKTIAQLVRGLGWFSIGLGLAQVLSPRGVARLVGVRGHRGLIRFLGMREIASGIGILSQRRPAGAVWARVGGDVMDLSLLGAALASDHVRRSRVLAAAAAVAGMTALDVYGSRQLSSGVDLRNDMTHVAKSITINRSPEELYAFWRNFEMLPRFMNHVEAVRRIDDKRSHWVVKAPAGRTVEWDAEIADDRPNEFIAWRSMPDADVDNSGSVRFERAPQGRGTVVKVEFDYRPPMGRLGATFAKLFGEAPEKQVHVDLHRFKQLMETGEIARTEGQPAGRSRSTSRRFDDFVRK